MHSCKQPWRNAQQIFKIIKFDVISTVVYVTVHNSLRRQTMNGSNEKEPEIKIDENNLYHEETFTDLKVGWIRRLTPVTPDGNRDRKRESLFVGQSQLATPQGPLPIQCQILAKTLPEAIKKFPEVMELTIKDMIERAKEIQRESTSRIITP
jgi:hypothetical protein